MSRRRGRKNSRGVMSKQRIYKVIFFSQGQVYEIYAHQVSQGSLFGFIEVEEMSFRERSKLVVDPSEERLAAEFEGVRRSYIPMHAIIRIDEVERVGAGKVSDVKGNVTPFPMVGYGPNGGGSGGPAR